MEQHDGRDGHVPVMAPEVISHQYYNQKCDVFSYGILLWELVSGGDIPYLAHAPTGGGGVVQRDCVRTIPRVVTRDGEVMQYGWQPDPNARPEFEQIVELLKHTELLADTTRPRDFSADCALSAAEKYRRIGPIGVDRISLTSSGKRAGERSLVS